jgi:hypothetical protein
LWAPCSLAFPAAAWAAFASCLWCWIYNLGIGVGRMHEISRGAMHADRHAVVTWWGLRSQGFFIGRKSSIFSKFPFYPHGPIKFDISQIFPFFPVSTQTIQIQPRDGLALIMIYSCFDLWTSDV